MRIRELSLRNFRVFESVDLELPARVIGIFGANGAGKSSLVEAITFACYGAARTDKKQVRTHGILTDSEVRLVFEHGGQQYEVRRALTGRNHQAQAELLAGGVSVAVGVRDVDQEIRKLLRMDQHVFRSSVFAEQKQLDAFSDLTRSRRKEMVLRLLGIRPVDEARFTARREARAIRGDADRLAGTLPDLAEREAALERKRAEAEAERRVAAEARSALSEARARAEEAERRFEALDRDRERVEKVETECRLLGEKQRELRERRADLEARADEIRRALGELPTLRRELESLGDARAKLTAAHRLAEAADELRQAEAELERLPDEDVETAARALAEAERSLREAASAAAGAREASRQAEAQLRVARQTLASTDDLDPTRPCPTCGQPLGEGFESYVEHCRGEVARLEKESAEAGRAATVTEKTEREAQELGRDAKKRHEQARSRAEVRRQAETHLKKLRVKLRELAGPFGGEVPDVRALERDAERLAEVERLLARAEGEKGHLERAEADLATISDEMDATARKLAMLAEEVAGLGFDPEEHLQARTERDESRKLHEEARDAEREASDRAKEIEMEAARLEADLARVREMTSKVGELREEAHYAGRVGILLDGFRDNLVSRIGPELSREAEALFRELTNHEYDDLKVDEEDLSIHIADGGAWFPIELSPIPGRTA